MIVLKFFILLALTSAASGQVEVKYFNSRFMWVSVATKYVKAGMSHPKENLSICWVEVKTKNESFDFITRRAVPTDECMHLVSETRKLLKKNNVVEIIGSGGSKTKRGDYFSMFDIIRAKSGCVGYFGGCENFEKVYEEWNDWKSKPIDSKMYP